MILIITNGDSAVEAIKNSGIEANILPWRDVLHDGPVPSGLNLQKMAAVRARFIAECGWGKYNQILKKTDTEKLACQLDAVVDLVYYCGNITKKHTGMPDESLDEVFIEVHKANMNKIHPDGTVHRREDGKILKPEGWKEPDIISVIKRLLGKSEEISSNHTDHSRCGQPCETVITRKELNKECP